MARYAWVVGDVFCPGCGRTVMDVTWFAWGGLLSDDINRGPVYRLDERLMWALDADGSVPANTYWEPSREGQRRSAFNLGDPLATNVDVYEERGVPGHCGFCGASLHRSCVSIRRGAISSVSLVSPGVVNDELHAVVYDESGQKVIHQFTIATPLQMKRS